MLLFLSFFIILFFFKVYTFSLLRNDTFLLVGSAELELRVFELEWFEQDEMDKKDDELLKKSKADGERGSGSSDTQENVSI